MIVYNEKIYNYNIVFCIAIFLIKYLIITDSDSVNCAKLMLNEFGNTISSDYEEIAGNIYSEGFDENSDFILSKSTYVFNWKKVMNKKEVLHVIKVERFTLCPILLGDINVVIPESSSREFEGYIKDHFSN